MFNQLNPPIVIAHRGASAHAPENTIAAFQLAVEQRADAIELDAKLSVDGYVVVIHDQTVNRTTPGSGRVKDMTLTELRSLDAGSHFDIAYQGEKIPTLEEVFERLGPQIYINVEITNYATPFDNLPQRVVALVQRYQLESKVMFSSFNPIALRRAHELLPEVPVGLLAFPGWKGAWARGWFGEWLVPYASLHPDREDVNAELVLRAHRKANRVYPYTVNSEEEMNRLFKLSVDGIFTDNPSLARQVLSKTDNLFQYP